MGLLGLLVGRAALIAIQNAQRRQQEREQHRATQPQPPPLPPRVGTLGDFKEGFIKGYNAFNPYLATEPPGAPPEYIARDNTLHNAQTFSALADAQADRIRQLEEQLKKLRTDQDYLNQSDEELREQEASEREEKKQAEEAEEQRRKQQEQEELRERKKREAEAQARRLASAQADRMRKKKRWEEYKASWERFRSLTPEAALFQSVQEIVPWPTSSGRFPHDFNEEEIKFFFVTGASFESGPARKAFADERKRWHPDSMNRWILQKGKEVDGETCKAITVIAQILNELCVA